MAGRAARGQLGRVAYTLYVTAYFAVLGFGLVGDLAGEHARAQTITPRASAVAGAVIAVIVIVAAQVGRTAVALRPSPAEVQYALLSPMSRQSSLARATGLSVVASMIGTAVAALVLMITSAPQFGGLSVGIQLSYVAFAAGVGLVAFALHLLVAERRWRAPLLALALLSLAASAYDVSRGAEVSPFTFAVRALREGAPALSVLGPFALGGVVLWLALARAEHIPLEMIGRGSDIADRAGVALLGNDLRTLLMLQRSMGAQPWRTRPHVRFGSRLARRFPVLMRALRGMARWRLYRWLMFLTLSSAIGALLRVHPATARTIGLASFALWLLGLILCEPLAQENDRSDRLFLLPRSRTIEYRHVAVSWSITFVWLLAVSWATVRDRTPALSIVAVAAAAASAATTAAAISYRREWKSVVKETSIFMPDMGSSALLISVLWPALVAAACLFPWASHQDGLVIAAPSAIVLGFLVSWINRGGVVKLFTPGVTPR
ncbi:MAG: hypothetical protein QOJ00_2 [Actinomycetota bacterium]